MRQVLAPGTETDDRIVGLSKAIDAAEASDDSWSWLVLRRIHALHHEHEPAQSLLGECLKDARILGLESEIGHLLRHRAWHLKMLSRPDEAEELLRAAVRHEQPGDLFPYWLALTLNELGDTLAAKVLQGGGQDDHRPPSAVPSMPTAKDGRCSSSPSWAAGHQSHR